MLRFRRWCRWCLGSCLRFLRGLVLLRRLGICCAWSWCLLSFGSHCCDMDSIGRFFSGSQVHFVLVACRLEFQLFWVAAHACFSVFRHRQFWAILLWPSFPGFRTGVRILLWPVSGFFRTSVRTGVAQESLRVHSARSQETLRKLTGNSQPAHRSRIQVWVRSPARIPKCPSASANSQIVATCALPANSQMCLTCPNSQMPIRSTPARIPKFPKVSAIPRARFPKHGLAGRFIKGTRTHAPRARTYHTMPTLVKYSLVTISLSNWLDTCQPRMAL